MSQPYIAQAKLPTASTTMIVHTIIIVILTDTDFTAFMIFFPSRLFKILFSDVNVKLVLYLISLVQIPDKQKLLVFKRHTYGHCEPNQRTDVQQKNRDCTSRLQKNLKQQTQHTVQSCIVDYRIVATRIHR